MYCSPLGHRPHPIGIVPREEGSREGSEGWGRGGGKAEVASSLLPSCLVFSEVLRLSKSVKPLCEDPPALLQQSGLWVLSKKMEHNRRVFYVSEDRNFQERNSVPTVRNHPPGEWSNTQQTPQETDPTGEHISERQAYAPPQSWTRPAGKSYTLLFKGTSKISSCSQQHQNAQFIILGRSWLSRTLTGEGE